MVEEMINWAATIGDAATARTITVRPMYTAHFTPYTKCTMPILDSMTVFGCIRTRTLHNILLQYGNTSSQPLFYINSFRGRSWVAENLQISTPVPPISPSTFHINTARYRLSFGRMNETALAQIRDNPEHFVIVGHIADSVVCTVVSWCVAATTFNDSVRNMEDVCI